MSERSYIDSLLGNDEVDWYIDWPGTDSQRTKKCSRDGHNWLKSVFGTQRYCPRCDRVESLERVANLTKRRLDLIEEELMKDNSYSTSEYNKSKGAALALAVLVCAIIGFVIVSLFLWTVPAFIAVSTALGCFLVGGYCYKGFRTGNW